MLNTITKEVHNLVLGMALNNRDIYRASIINTMEETYGLNVEFKTPEAKNSWILTDCIEDDETRELLHRAFKMPRKRMAVRATFVK